MDDIPPKISITLDTQQAEFLKRITTVVNGLDTYIGEPSDVLGGAFLGSIEIKLKNSPKTTVQVLLDPETPTIARIEAYPDTGRDDPTYEQFVAAAQQVLEPLLDAYNQQYQGDLRLDIQSKEDTEPKLPPTVQRSFDQFVNAANKGMLHSLDWGRWYRFVRLADREDVSLGEDDIRRMLRQQGFSEERANHIADVYHHGRAILAQE